jgi:hypothetical protein
MQGRWKFPGADGQIALLFGHTYLALAARWDCSRLGNPNLVAAIAGCESLRKEMRGSCDSIARDRGNDPNPAVVPLNRECQVTRWTGLLTTKLNWKFSAIAVVRARLPISLERRLSGSRLNCSDRSRARTMAIMSIDSYPGTTPAVLAQRKRDRVCLRLQPLPLIFCLPPGVHQGSEQVRQPRWWQHRNIRSRAFRKMHRSVDAASLDTPRIPASKC